MGIFKGILWEIYVWSLIRSLVISRKEVWYSLERSKLSKYLQKMKELSDHFVPGVKRDGALGIKRGHYHLVWSYDAAMASVFDSWPHLFWSPVRHPPVRNGPTVLSNFGGIFYHFDRSELYQTSFPDVREAPLNLASPLFGHCPNSDYTSPPHTQTGTLGHFFSGPIWANL